MASQNDREMKIVILLLAAALLILGAVAVAAASDRTDRMPVAVFDLRRYMGTWYEIARYDHSFERRLAGVQAHYELLSDGRVTVENSGVDSRSDRRKRARGKARATAMPCAGLVFLVFLFGLQRAGTRPRLRLGAGGRRFVEIPLDSLAHTPSAEPYAQPHPAAGRSAGLPHRETVVRGSGAGNFAAFAVKAFVRA